MTHGPVPRAPRNLVTEPRALAMAAPFRPTTEIYLPGAHTLEQQHFTSPDVFARERERIFRRRWVCVGREEDVADRGAFVTAAVGGESIIVVRDQAGRLHAHHNVCRHRGTRLCTEPRGRFRETIQCPYHAWTYRLDGRLIGAPHMGDVPGFRKDDYPLVASAVAVWEGFVFVCLADQPEPFDRAFAPMIDRLARFNLPALRSARRIVYDVRANWKLVCENYSECLHCPTLHPDLARLSPYQSGENDLVDGPFLGGYMTITRDGGSMTRSGGRCGVPVAPNLGPDLGRVYYYTLFPNLLLSLHPDYVMFHTLWPQSPDTTRIVCEWLFHPAAFAEPGFDPDDAVGFWDTTNRQDWDICERNQQGVESVAYRLGPYSARESVVAAWDREYLRVMA